MFPTVTIAHHSTIHAGKETQMPRTFTHLDNSGHAHMVNVGNKPDTRRIAKAGGYIQMLPATLQMILSVTAAKGDVLAVARIAAIQAAKRTSELIPLCHPLALTKIDVEFLPNIENSSLCIEVSVETLGKTGVEMEALCGANIGLLTIYDMCKAVDRGMTVNDVKVLEKSGGKSGTYRRKADKKVSPPFRGNGARSDDRVTEKFRKN